MLLPSFTLVAQQSDRMPSRGTPPATPVIGTPTERPAAAPAEGQETQMVTCTDKLTFVDRNGGPNYDTQVGGYTGWWSCMQTYPNFTGTVTEAYATLRRVGTNTPVTLYVWALNNQFRPTGSPLDSVQFTVNTPGYTEFGGPLTSPVTISQYGFCIGVWVQGADYPDSVMVAWHDDFQGNGLNFYYYQQLYNAYVDIGEASDFLIRAKISYNGPTGSVAATPSSGCPGTPVNFTHTQTGVPAWYSAVWANQNVTYNWNFGDSNTSTSAAPSHTYSASGPFTVTGTRNNPGWTTTCPATGTIVLPMSSVVPAVTAAASATTVCPSDNVTFQATPAGGGSSPTYQWKKNGFNVGTGQTYSASGFAGGDVVECVMTSSDPCASPNTATSNQVTMSVQPGSISAFSYVRTGLLVNFTSLSQNAVSYLWDYGDSQTGTAPNPAHTYGSAGTYTAQLTTTNICGATNASTLNLVLTSSGGGSGSNVGVEEHMQPISGEAFPNPVNTELNVVYSLQGTADVTVEVMNSLGQVVSTTVLQNTSGGTVRIAMDGLAPGMYFVRLSNSTDQTVLRVTHQ